MYNNERITTTLDINDILHFTHNRPIQKATFNIHINDFNIWKSGSDDFSTMQKPSE